MKNFKKGNIINNMFKTMTKIRDSNNSDFEYNDILDDQKYITIDKIRKLGKNLTHRILFMIDITMMLGIVKIK
jgi:hypothetical protein